MLPSSLHFSATPQLCRVGKATSDQPASPAASGKVYDCFRRFSCTLPHLPAPSTLVVLKHTNMAQSQQVSSLVTFKNSLIRAARQPRYKAL
jgi:hypothetical protein